MNEFEKLYNKIIEESYGNILKKFPINEDYDTFKIIDEIVQSNLLTPVPDALINEIMKNLFKQGRVMKISYIEIINLISDIDSETAQVLLSCLRRYAYDPSGNLHIILLNPDDEEETKNVISKLIKNIDNEEDAYFKIKRLLESRDSNGLTILRENLQFERFKDCVIYLNFKNKDWKDTLEHELKHFIQRICSFDKHLPMIMTLNKNNIFKAQHILTSFKKHFKNKEFIIDLNLFLNNKLSKTEQHQTITSMIKFFIRTYEKSKNTYEINHKRYSISQIENQMPDEVKLKIRLKWLDEFLSKINNYTVFDYEQLETYLNTRKRVVTEEIQLQLMCLIYLYVKNFLVQYDIDRILKNEFEKFKFRKV